MLWFRGFMKENLNEAPLDTVSVTVSLSAFMFTLTDRLPPLSDITCSQVLGSHRRRLHSLSDGSTRVHHDISRVVCSRCGLVGTTIRLEGSGLYAENRAAKVHGLAGRRLSGE